MPTVFNTGRAVVYCVVLLFSIVCLAMSAHFQHVLSASDLTRFVPFAIFVCSISMLIFVLLLVSSLLLRERNPISTRIELACLGLLGILWLALGAFLASSDAGEADVECYASETAQEPLDDSLASFHTDQFQAMYRVLTACSLLNAALVLLCFFTLLLLILRRHKNGDQHMWYAPVTSGAWLQSYQSGKPGAGRSQRHRQSTKDRSILPTSHNRNEKPARSQTWQSNGRTTGGVYLTEKPSRIHSGQSRQPSTRRWATEAIVEGGMRNPAKDPERPRR